MSASSRFNSNLMANSAGQSTAAKSTAAKSTAAKSTAAMSTPASVPLVSVVIPTLNRPHLVSRAVQTALQQSFQALEVIVVVDGPDQATLNALAKIDDSRLRVLINAENRGCASSRIRGIEAAQGEWIAHLDDDDAWTPHKLEKQLAVAGQSVHPWPVVSCLCDVEFDNHREVWPRRLPSPGEPMSEYLFIRNSLFQGEGLMQSSTLLVPRSLYDQIPLSLEHARHDDWDWILLAAHLPGVDFHFVSEPLALWNLQTSHLHSSSAARNHWKGSRSWLRSRRELVTPRAYAAFLMAEVASRAAAAGDVLAFFSLLAEASWRGKPTLKMLLLYLGMWLFPQPLRQLLRRARRRWLSPKKSRPLSSPEQSAELVATAVATAAATSAATSASPSAIGRSSSAQDGHYHSASVTETSARSSSPSVRKVERV